MDAGKLDRLITVESFTVARDSGTGAEVRTWATLGAAFWAEVLESATATDEGLTAAGVATYARPTRVRCRYRSDIDATMRLNLGSNQLLQIIGVAMIGRREGLELACKEWAHE
jgi:head-tail adaptor